MSPLRQRLHASVGGLPGVFWTLWWGLLVNRLATFVVAFLATYLVRERGFSPAEAGRIAALFGIGQALAGPVGGALADRVGRRPTMMGGLLLAAAATGALPFATAPALLALLSFLCGLLGALVQPAMSASVADVVPSPERARAFGLIYWAVNIGLTAGLLLAAALAERSFTALFLIDAGTSLAFALIVWARVPETRPRELAPEPVLRGFGRVLSDRTFMPFLVLQLLALMVFVQWQLGLPLDMTAHGFGPSAYALLMALNCAGVVLLQPLLGPVLAGRDPARLLAAQAALIGLGFGVNALGGSLWVYAVGTALWTVGEVVGFPTASALAAELAPAELRGRYQGTYGMAWGLALTLGPLAGGELYGRGGGRLLWLACLALALLVSAGHLLAGAARRARRPGGAGEAFGG
ncbi:MAG: MFS transporter [Deltaproteobacteria bacterium]|nr:MFS transporter [Deltaproteobacteria bacterium]